MVSFLVRNTMHGNRMFFISTPVKIATVTQLISCFCFNTLQRIGMYEFLLMFSLSFEKRKQKNLVTLISYIVQI